MNELVEKKTENRHTPGPWKIDYETEELKADTYVLGRIYGCSCEDSPDCIANANLAAAAPDLLEALKVAVKTIETWYNMPALFKNVQKEVIVDTWCFYRDHSPKMKRIFAAITKAEGGAE